MIPTAPKMAFPELKKKRVSILQFNIGRLCNQACHHCHVDSSPLRSSAEDNASAELIDQVMALLQDNPGIHSLDITGGAPELNPGFRRLVTFSRSLDRQVLVRHNLTVQGEEGQADLPDFFCKQQVQLFCSLPCYTEENVNRQRGNGVFERSILALQRLNAVGFGVKNNFLLNLVYNPGGPQLPPPQESLELQYRKELQENFGISFHRLLTITNQPIHRFRESLQRKGAYSGYMDLLREHFNPATLDAVMCREAMSLRWDGRLFDCDFNLVKGLPMRNAKGEEIMLHHIGSLKDLKVLENSPIQVAEHCFACTAGSGSSCGGSLVV